MKAIPTTGHQAMERAQAPSPNVVSPSTQAPVRADPAESPGAQDVSTLFRAHAGFIASFLRRLGAPAPDVDDLVQEVFLVAHRKGGYQPGTGQPRTWLAAIALRVASTGRRSRGRRREDPLAEVGGSEQASDDPARTLEARRALERVQRALDSLELDQRAAFVLYELEGQSCESIAAAFEVPIGTIYSRLHHARKRFLDAHAQLLREEAASAADKLSTRLAEGL
jgi:RNA polymerase sigma-70 factor (ECF subfamily)